MLSDHGGFFIDITDNAKQALDVLENERYDLILMDVNMPDMSGIEATEQIKANTNPKVAKTPIIVMSANPTKEEARVCKNLGIKHYLPRPHTREELFLAMYKSLKVKKTFD